MITKLRVILILLFVAALKNTFGQAPNITSFSPSSGSIGTIVTINGTNLNSPTAFTIGGQTAIVVSNTGSTLVAMVMPNATTGAVSITTGGGTATGGDSFTVTATQFPSTQQGAKLVATDGVGSPFQGNSVALSADGNTAIVGGPYDNFYQGAAWVYTRSGGAWVQQGSKLVGTGVIGYAHQGTSVAISADGNTAIVGGANDNSGVGAAWIFTRVGGTWTQQGSKLLGAGSTGAAYQGNSVSLSADGNTAVVGGPYDNSNQGAIWVYTRSGGTWVQQGAKLVGTGNTGAAYQGISVSVSAGGNTAMAGGYADNSSQGAAWVYIRSGTTWTQQGSKLVGTGVIGVSGQGYSVSLSADGNTAIVGGYADNSDQGAAWIYTRNGESWAQQGSKLIGTGNSGAAYQGYSVSLSADGNTAIMGGFADSSRQGAAWVYARIGGSWAQQGSKLVGTGNMAAAYQGWSISLCADGNTAMIGGPNDDTFQGAAWVFTSSNIATLSAIGSSINPLTPLFDSETTSYTLSVSNATASMTVTPVSTDANATIKVNGTNVASGTTSEPISLVEGATNTINIVVTAQDGVTMQTYTITVTRAAPSSVATLSSLKPSKGTLSPAFSSATTSYTASVVNGVTSLTITPTATDPTATIKVDGTVVASGSTSQNLPLVVGANSFPIKVTAQDGTTTKTYTVMVTRGPSANCYLSNLKPSAGSLTPTFSASKTAYSTAVVNGATTITITPITAVPTSTVTVNGTAVASGTASAPIALNVGSNIITTVVTAQDGTTTRTYTLTVTRAASSNANLSAFKISKGTLTPAFAPATTSYTASVVNGVTSMTVTPTAADITATITVNGTVVPSGTTSGAIELAVGSNTITTIVTAQDGVTTKTYTLTVTRAAGAGDSFDPGISVTAPTESPTLEDDIILVHQAISPNGDGINDFLVIDGIQAYPDNKLTIMNRSGQLVYETSGYDNSSKVFDGHSNKNGQMQLPGTYFYQLDYTVKGIIKHKTGFLVLKY